MPAIQGRTLKQLRQAVGFNLGALHTGTAYDAGSNTTLISLSFYGGDDTYNGKWAAVADATNSNNTEFRIISDYTASAYRITLQQQLSFATAAGDSYEIWDEPYKPENINEFINQAIVDSTGKVYDPIENISLHGDGKQTRYDIPSGISQISKIEYRNKISFTRLHACNTAFDGAAVTNFTSEVDTKIKKQGTGSVKFSLNDAGVGGVSAGAILTADISSVDISKYDYLECWIKSSIATSAGNLKISLDDTADCVSPLETLSIPALSEDTWTFVRLQLSNPELNTAIVSLGLEQDADIGNGAKYYVWLDDIKVVQNDTAEWSTLDRRLWKIDKEARSLVLLREGHKALGYSLIKIIGGDKPALLSSETDTTEIPEAYIVAFATARALLSTSGGASTDPDSKRQLAGYWDGELNRAKASFPMLTNVRTVD